MHDDFYQMYLEEMKRIAPCSREEKERLLKEAAQGIEEAKKRLIEGSLLTALEYAKEFEGQGVLMNDLVQEANMALILAIEEYRRGEDILEFDSFAAQRIREALEAAVKEQQSADKTGEELVARVNVLLKVSQTLAGELGREATVEELAQKMKMSVDEVQNIMKMAMDAMSVNAENMAVKALSQEDGAGIPELNLPDGTDEI